MSPNFRGALLMTASMASFVLNDTFLKLTGGVIPLFQLIFLRGVLSMALVLILAQSMGALRFNIAPRDRGIIVMRGLIEVAIAYFFLNALFNMPLGNLNAIMQVVPLTVTLATALIFREAVGWRRMLAILIGFFGVMLIIRPGAEGFNIWSLYALAAVFCVTIRDLITRRLSSDVPGMTVTAGTTAAVLIAAGLASTTSEWVAISALNALYISASAVVILGGYYFSIQAMRVGDVSFNAPFRYTGLIGAMIVGYLVFDEIPRSLTLLGAAIVVGTGIFTLYRERRLSRP